VRRVILFFAVATLALAGCSGGKGNHASSTAAPSTAAPTPSVNASPVAMPKGTWTGDVSQPFDAWQWVRVTLPAKCVESGPCGRQKLICVKGAACAEGHTSGGPLMLYRVAAHGAFILDSNPRSRYSPVFLKPKGDTLLYQWGDEGVTGTLRPAGRNP